LKVSSRPCIRKSARVTVIATTCYRLLPEHRAHGGAVRAAPPHRQRGQLVASGTDLEEVETFEDGDARTQQTPVGGRTLDAEAFDRKVIRADQLHTAIHQPARGFRLQIHEIRAKRPRRMPESRVAGAKENPGAAPGDP